MTEHATINNARVVFTITDEGKIGVVITPDGTTDYIGIAVDRVVAGNIPWPSTGP